LIEWSLEVENGLFMIGCVFDLSFVVQACRSCDELLYGLIYFQTRVIVVCLKFVEEFCGLNSAAYISDGKLLVVLFVEDAPLCSMM